MSDRRPTTDAEPPPLPSLRAVADLQRLRAFVAVAHGGSVSRAAQRLHLSQPAVSLQLKALADSLGAPLFTRGARGLTLAPAGALLLPQAERVLAALADFNTTAARLHEGVRGTLRIGTILDPAFTRLGFFLKELVERAPQIATDLRHGMSGSVLQGMARDELDVGFYLADPSATAPPDEERGVALQRLIRFSYRVIAPAGWAPQVLGRDWRALATLPWLSTPPASAHHRLLARVFGPASLTGLTPHYVARVDQEASMLDLVKSGVGLSLMRDSIAMREQQASGLAVADKVSLACDLSFIYLQARADEPVIAEARQALAAAWRL
jgi:DNA-binding transcriptional LysR family regulator